MKKLLGIVVLGLLLSGCTTVSKNEPINYNNNNEFFKLALASKANLSVKIAHANESGIWMFGNEKYGFNNWVSINSNDVNPHFLQTAKNYCTKIKKNTYLNYKAATVPKHKWGALMGENYYNNQFDYYEKGILVEYEKYLVHKYVCANNKNDALVKAGSWIYDQNYLFSRHDGQWKTTEYKRILTAKEVNENKIKAEQKKVKQAKLKEEKRKNFMTNLDKLYGKECVGGAFKKKLEKGTVEFDNCLLDKDNDAKLKAQAERELLEKKNAELEKKQAALNKKLAAMKPKERHAYNCSETFKFKKGTEKFNDCVFKLYTAELDLQKLELEKKVAEAQIKAAATEQARAEAVADAQIAAANASERSARLRNSIQLMKMGSDMLGGSSSSSSSNSSSNDRLRTTCRNVGGFLVCN